MGSLLVVDPSIRSAERVGSALICAVWGGPAVVVRPALEGWGEVDLDQAWAGLVVMGSAASVNDPSPWRDLLMARLGRALSEPDPPPILGICYGHQLLARVAGAEVGGLHATGTKEIGIRTVELVAPCPLFAPERPSYRIAVSHYDAARAVPPGFRRVAGTAACPIHAIAHETRPLFGVQGHPEFSDAALEIRGHVGASDPDRIRDGRDIISRFADLVRARERVSGAVR